MYYKMYVCSISEFISYLLKHDNLRFKNTPHHISLYLTQDNNYYFKGLEKRGTY
jgi:hypothetical protein